MTANAPAVPVSRQVYRIYWPAILTGLVLVILAFWLFQGNGLQVILSWDPVVLWIIILAILTIALMIIGRVTTKRWSGALISSRYKMSLARLQIVLWTLLVLSAYFTIAVHRLYGEPVSVEQAILTQLCEQFLGKDTVTAEECAGSPINITFPSELLVAMGISAASFAGTTIIHSAKKGKKVDIDTKNHRVKDAEQKMKKAGKDLDSAAEALEKARMNMDEQIAIFKNSKADVAEKAAFVKAAAENDLNQAALRRQSAKRVYEAARKNYEKELEAQKEADAESEGLLHKNKRIEDARLADIFMGDELGNCQIVDMSKVQMFFLTVVVLLVYAAAVAATLHDAQVMHNPAGYAFPPFSDTLNSLMAISHGTYLTVKTADHTNTTP